MQEDSRICLPINKTGGFACAKLQTHRSVRCATHPLLSVTSLLHRRPPSPFLAPPPPTLMHHSIHFAISPPLQCRVQTHPANMQTEQRARPTWTHDILLVGFPPLAIASRLDFIQSRCESHSRSSGNFRADRSSSPLLCSSSGAHLPVSCCAGC